jgi:hypothetical protein
MDKQHRNLYDYNSVGDLVRVGLNSIADYIEPLKKSYYLDRANFVIQSINLTFVFIIVNFFTGDLITYVLEKVTSSGIFGLKVVGLFALTIFFSAINRIPFLKWQTIFQLNRKLTRWLFIILLLINVSLYGKTLSYEKR